MSRIYCGAKTCPVNSVRGTPLQCFRKGIAIGRIIETQKQKKNTFTSRQIEAATTAITKRKMAQDILNKGLNILKHEIRLNDLRSKDLIRDLARRVKITNYSTMSQDQLIQQLVQHGFRR